MLHSEKMTFIHQRACVLVIHVLAFIQTWKELFHHQVTRVTEQKFVWSAGLFADAAVCAAWLTNYWIGQQKQSTTGDQREGSRAGCERWRHWNYVAVKLLYLDCVGGEHRRTTTWILATSQKCRPHFVLIVFVSGIRKLHSFKDW